jgi:predicted RNA binding protein YcfA (HicA-like mRNA interferase family)
MLRLLQVELGYAVVRQSGSHRTLVAEGRPMLTFAFHDNRSLTPVEVRGILIKQVGLSVHDALKVVRGGR